MNTNIDQLFALIAQKHLFIETLETRKSDSMDFHDVSVWGVKSALTAAYQAGLAAGQDAAAKPAICSELAEEACQTQAA